MSPTYSDSQLSALESCRVARKLWLSSQVENDLKEVERLYRRALSARKIEQIHVADGTTKQQAGKTKRRKLELDKNDYKAAGEKLALLMCQSKRAKKAKMGLASLGYTCRLSSSILDYPFKQKENEEELGIVCTCSPIPPCIVCDDFLSDYQQQFLKDVFEDPLSSYWVDHNYQIEPPSPYFSYAAPLTAVKNLGFLGNLITKIFNQEQLREKFPRLKKAKYVEMWLHNRPHPSGHQMHFDSDDEGRGGVRNPIISTIVFITAGSGGPSLVTNQKIGDQKLATHGWLSHPKEKRLVAFDGKVLHGVVPGKGVCNGRRVTMMLAFWEHIEMRNGTDPCAARPFPSDGDWLQKLTHRVTPGDDTSSNVIESHPIEIDGVYETLDGDRWTKRMPDYNKVFQGF